MLNVDTIAIRDDLSSSIRRKQQVVGTTYLPYLRYGIHTYKHT